MNHKIQKAFTLLEVLLAWSLCTSVMLGLSSVQLHCLKCLKQAYQRDLTAVQYDNERERKLLKSSGFTLIDILLALVLSSMLSVTLTTVYIHIKRRYEIAMTLATMQNDGRYAVTYLKNKIRTAKSVMVYSYDAIPSILKRKLKSKSDVLVVGREEKYQGRKQFVKRAYYISKTSWKQDGKSVLALFSKPLQGRRQEIVPFVSNLVLKVGADNALPAMIKDFNSVKGIGFNIVLESGNKAFKAINRKWYGFAAIRSRLHE